MKQREIELIHKIGRGRERESDIYILYRHETVKYNLGWKREIGRERVKGRLRKTIKIRQEWTNWTSSRERRRRRGRELIKNKKNKTSCWSCCISEQVFDVFSSGKHRQYGGRHRERNN